MSQIGAEEWVLSSSTIWLCLSCEVCSTRCPAEINIAKVMDTLRKISVDDKYSTPQSSIVNFHNTFLDSVKKHGRLSEFEFSVKYNLALRKPFKNLKLAIKLFQKRKIKPLGENTESKENIRKIFDKSRRFVREKE